MVRALRNFILFALAVVVAIVALCYASGAFSTSADAATASANPVDNAKAAVLNAAINSSGVKTAIENAIEDNVGQIAQATGLSTTQVRSEIGNLDIENWQVVPSAQVSSEKASYPISSNGVNATVTTYDNPDYVTVNAYGQSLTFKVPETAQAYEGYLAYL